MRYFIGISYLGTDFHGWQAQNNAHTVQAEIQNALKKLLGKETILIGSGRTDTGVHATGQVAHFDADPPLDIEVFVFKINRVLPESVSVNWCRPVKVDAHARFAAKSRAYVYYIHGVKNPFKRGRSYYFITDLNVPLIQEACEIIRSWQNFQCFSRVRTDVKHYNCSIQEISWEKTNDGHLFSVRADRFLRGMVRSMVGTLLEVGKERMSLAEFRAVLESNDRKRAGKAVVSDGLYLTEVTYRSDVFLN